MHTKGEISKDMDEDVKSADESVSQDVERTAEVVLAETGAFELTAEDLGVYDG